VIFWLTSTRRSIAILWTPGGGRGFAPLQGHSARADREASRDTFERGYTPLTFSASLHMPEALRAKEDGSMQEIT
jgi:hypothetical protein